MSNVKVERKAMAWLPTPEGESHLFWDHNSLDNKERPATVMSGLSVNSEVDVRVQSGSSSVTCRALAAAAAEPLHGGMPQMTPPGTGVSL